MDYALFLLVNATLFLRPAEVDPDLAGWPIYNALILADLALASGVVAALFDRRLAESPVTCFVLGLGAMSPLSLFARGDFGLAADAAMESAKLTLYFLLLTAVVSTPGRLRRFLLGLAGFTAVLTALALLQFHGWVEIESLEAVADLEVDPATGEEYVLRRLCSTGIFHDPNDLSTILLVGMILALYFGGERRLGVLRHLWLGPLALFSWAFTLTHSKGGFLALLAAVCSLFQSRFGWRRSLPPAALAVPGLFVAFAGRQTDLSAAGDSAQDRLRVWAEGFALLRRSPIAGIGGNRFASEAGMVAHNSFLQAYAELGLVGGTLFLASFAYAYLTLSALGRHAGSIVDPGLRRLRPYLAALVAAYAAGLLSLSRNNSVPTYLVLGLVAAYLRLVVADEPRLMPDPVARLDARLAARMALIGLAFVGLSNLFVKAFLALA